MSDYESNKKVYKAIRIVSHGSMDGTCETGKSVYIQWFDDLEKAIDFAGNRKGVDNYSCLASRIFEYTIISERELEQKLKTVEVVTKQKFVWE